MRLSGTPHTDLLWSEGTALSPELRTVLACARAFINREQLPGFRATLAMCPSVDRLCKVAVAQGMLGHLHRLVKDREGVAPDPALVERLAELQLVSEQRNLRFTGHLLRILDMLRAVGVEAMPYKGPAWAERLYGDIGLRSWADLDLIVPYKQVGLVRETLLANGFVDASRFNSKLMARGSRGWGEVAFHLVEDRIVLEVHWEVGVGFSGRALPAHSLLARAGRLCLLDQEVRSPSTVDLLLISCLNGTRDQWDGVEKLLGLAVQVRDTLPGSWPGVMTAAHIVGCRRRVIVGVAHVCRVLGLETPTEVATLVARDAGARALLRSLRPESLDREVPRTPRRELAALRWKFATEDTVMAGLWHAATRLLRPGPEDWESIALPAHAEWLYYLLRPARLIIKWAKRL